MDFDFSAEQTELRNQVRRLLTDKCPSAAVRTVMENGDPFAASLWAGLAEMGLMGIRIPEAYGGLELSYLELCVVAEELGRVCAPVPFSSSIYLATEFLLTAGNEQQKASWLPRLASGEAIGTFAFGEAQGWMSPMAVNAILREDRLSGTKLAVPDGFAADFAVVAARADEGLVLCIADLTAPGVLRMPIETIDAARGHANIVFDDVAAERLGNAAGAWPVIQSVFDKAAVLFAFEQVGGADAALAMARDFALDRMAFGRQIGSFQAIKHLMADMFVSLALARSNAYFAAWALAVGAPELPVAAATARVSATKAYQLCAKENIQIHGGMGFTWEADCHFHYRRSNLLAINIGGPLDWEDKLIERLQVSAA